MSEKKRLSAHPTSSDPKKAPLSKEKQIELYSDEQLLQELKEKGQPVFGTRQ